MKKILSLLFSLFLASAVADAGIVMSPIFSDGMVLQQDSDVRIWGTASPANTVTLVTGWDNRLYSCKAAPNGNWAISVRTPVAGGPYNIIIRDDTEHVINDVMIGEVWICSGQSNMEMPVKGFLCQPVEDAMAMLLDADNSDVRAYTVRRQLSDAPVSTCSGQWLQATSETVPDISAVAYTFADRLSRTLGVTVGIVISSWGGSSILGWMPEDNILKTISQEEADEILAVNTSDKNHPGKLFNGMIAPIAGYRAKGFIWYQGEANVGYAEAYGKLTGELVSCWRRAWNSKGDDMAFYAVEIAPHRYGKGNENAIDRPLLVEAQYAALKKCSNTALIPTSDVGDNVCIHPAKKRQVGDRLAVTALEKIYGKHGFESEPPAIEKISYENGRAIVYTSSALGPSPSRIYGFEIAGKDGYFYEAKALTDRRAGTIILTAEEVPEPVAVRYAFHNCVNANWTNWMGIPALPYRSDRK